MLSKNHVLHHQTASRPISRSHFYPRAPLSPGAGKAQGSVGWRAWFLARQPRIPAIR